MVWLSRRRYYELVAAESGRDYFRDMVSEMYESRVKAQEEKSAIVAELDQVKALVGTTSSRIATRTTASGQEEPTQDQLSLEEALSRLQRISYRSWDDALA